MGLETYLLKVKFEAPLPEQELLNTFGGLGLKCVKAPPELGQHQQRALSEYLFELRSDAGLIECRCVILVQTKRIEHFHLRFSILSPTTVVEKTFDFLKALNEKYPITIIDTEIANHFFICAANDKPLGDPNQDYPIPIDAVVFKQNEFAVNKREMIMKNVQGQVIESGTATLKEIGKNNLMSRFLAWFMKRD